MPGNVDERVLSMKFDNKQFEKGIEQSSKSIDGFKKKLDFGKMTSGLKTFSSGIAGLGKGGFRTLQTSAEKTTSSVTKAVKGVKELGSVSLEGLQMSMASLGEKLDSLGSLGEMAMYRVKNAILDATQSAIQFSKSLSLDQISQGLAKYEEKISSIKTISNATGLDAEAVDSQLDRLIWFTDETSASFSAMVSNIGKFTSVGQELGKSITAMQGIATWGYQSGASVAEQTRAMYNLSQALGTGSVKLIDWKSIENAGMATKEFKEQAIAAAEAAGTLKRKGDKLFTAKGNKEVSFSNFNETLSKGWFTSDVLMSVLEEYGGFADEVRRYQEQHPQYSLASAAMEAMDAEREAKHDDLMKQLEELSKSSETSTKELESNIKRINKIADAKERAKEISELAKTLGIDSKKLTEILDGLAKTEESLGEKAFKSSQQAKSFNEAIDATKDAVSTQWMTTFSILFGGLDDSIELWSDVTEMLWDIFASGGDARNNMLTHWAENFKGREDLFGEDGFIHSVYDSIMSVKEVLGTGFKDVFFPSLNKALSVTQQDAMDMANGLTTIDQLKFAQQGNLAGYELKKFTTSIREFGESIRDFFTDETNVKNMGKALRGLLSVVKAGVNILGAFGGGISDFLDKSGALTRFLEIFADIGDRIQSFFHQLQADGTWEKLREEVTGTLMQFDGLLDDLDLSFVTSGLQALFDIFRGGWKFVQAVLDGVSGFLKNSGIINKVLALIDDFAKRISSFIDRIEKSGVFRSITNTITTMLTDVGSLIDDLDLSFVDHVLDGIFAAVRGIAGFIKPIVSGIAKGLKQSKAVAVFSGIITNLSDSVKKFFDSFRKKGDYKKLENSITELVSKFVKLFAKLDFGPIDNFLSGVRGVIVNAWEGLKVVFNGILDFLNTFGIPQAVLNVFGTIGKWLTWLSDKMAEYHVWEDFSAGIQSGITKAKEVFDHFRDEITRFLEDSGIAAKFREWKEKLKEWLFPTSLGENGETTGIAAIFEKIRNAFNDGMETLKNVKIYDWLMEKWQWLKDSGIIEGLKSFWETLKGLFSGGSGAGDSEKEAKEGEEAVVAQGSFLDTLKNTFSNLDLSSISGALIGIGGLVLAFIAVISISKLIKKVTGVVGTVTGFVEKLGEGVDAFTNALKRNTKIAQIALLIAAIGGAIWLVADAISKLGQLKPEQLIAGGIAFAGIVAGLLLFFMALKKLSKDKQSIKLKDMLAIVVITLMVDKLSDALIRMAQLKPEQLAVGLGGMAAMLLMVSGFMKLMQSAKGGTAVDLGLMFTIGDVLLKLSDVVIKLGALPVKQMVKGLAGLGALMLMLGIFMKQTTTVINKDHYSAKNTAGFMKLIGVALAVLLLSKVLIRLSEMTWDQIAHGLAAMTGIMALLAVFMRMTNQKLDLKSSSKNTAGFLKLIGLALTMVILAGVLERLGNLSWEQIGKGLTAMAGVMLILGIFIKAMMRTIGGVNEGGGSLTFMKNDAGFFKLIGIALTLTLVAHAFQGLAGLSWGGIVKGIIALTAIMGLIMILMKSSKVSVADGIKMTATFGAMVGIGIAITLFAMSLKSLATIPFAGILSGIVGLTGILLAIALFMKMTSKLTNAGGLMKGLLVLIPIAAAMGLFVVALQVVKDINPAVIIAFGVSLAAVMAAVGILMTYITIAGNVPIAAMIKGALAISAVLVIILGVATALIAGLGALSNAVPAFKSAMEAGVVIFELIGKAFGSLVGGFIGGILTGIANAGPEFSEGIATLGKGIKTFADSIKGMGGAASKDSEAAIETLLSLVVMARLLPKQGGLSQLIFGSTDMSGFATGIKDLGTGLKSFANSIKGVNKITDRDRETAITTILALVGIAHILPRKGGMMQKIFGQGDLGEFASNIGDLGKGLRSFSNSIRGMSKASQTEDMSAAMKVANDLAVFAKFVTDPGSFGDVLKLGLGKMLGVNTNFEDFIGYIEPFGKALNSYSKAVKGIGTISGDSSNAISVAEDILAFKNKVEDPGTIGNIMLNWFASITGTKTTFRDFIDNIAPFGEALSAYADAIGGFSKKLSSEDSTAALETAESIRQFADKFKAAGAKEAIINAMQTLFGGNDYITDFTNFASQIAPFGEALKSYASSITGFSSVVESGDTDAAIKAATGLQKFAGEFGSDTFTEALLGTIDNLFGGGSAITKFSQFTEQMPEFGKGLKAYAEGISEIAVVSEEDQKSALQAAKGLKSFADSFGDSKAEDGKGLFSSIADSICDFFRGGDNSMEQFATFSAGMIDFGLGLTNYANGVKDIVALEPGQTDTAMAAVTAIKAFADTLVTEAGTDNTWFDNLMSFSGSWFGEDNAADSAAGELGTFGTSMQKLGEGIEQFATAAGKVDLEKSGNAIEAIKSIAELAKSDLLDDGVEKNGGGLWNRLDKFFNGDKIGRLNSFADDMANFGESISKFATSLQEYPTDELPIGNAVKAVRDFATAISVLTDDNSLVEALGKNSAAIDFLEGTFTGSDEAQKRFDAMMDIVGRMGTFGTNISSFSNAVKDYEAPKGSTWDQLKQTLGDMVEFAKGLGASGYNWGGTYQISQLAYDLKIAAPDFIEFAKILNGTSEEFSSVGPFQALSADQLATFDSIINTLTTLASSLAGLKSAHTDYLTKDKFYNLEEFGKGVVKIAEGVGSLLTSLGSISSDDVVEGGKFDKLILLIDKFKEITLAFQGLAVGGFGTPEFYTIEDLGRNVKGFFDEMSGVSWGGIDAGKLSDAAAAVTMLSYAAARLKEAAVTSGEIGTMREIIQILLGLNGTDDAGSGETLANNFIVNFCTTLNQKVNTETASTGNVFIAGHNISIGFANGMMSEGGLTAVANAGYTVARTAIQAMKDAAQEKSPSKITEQIGRYMSEGLSIGIGEEDSSVIKNATSVVGLALDAFSTALDEDMERQPMITPVVDLSNVEAGAEAAGDLFGGRYNLGVNTSSDLAGRASRGGPKNDSITNVTVDTSSVAATIDAMNARIETLANQMTNLRVVLNNGVLVGEIAPQMDRELGRLANRNAVS